MENASKALLIAGGILIAIIIIALLVRVGRNISSFKKTELSVEEQKQLTEFNEKFTVYLGKYVYGTEVITVVNMAQNSKYKIEVYNGDEIIENLLITDELKNKAFYCSNIGYDSSGRVNSITFVEKAWGNLN